MASPPGTAQQSTQPRWNLAPTVLCLVSALSGWRQSWAARRPELRVSSASTLIPRSLKQVSCHCLYIRDSLVFNNATNPTAEEILVCSVLLHTARVDLASNFRGMGKSAKGDFSAPLEIGFLDCG